MTKTTLVIAGSYRQFEDWAKDACTRFDATFSASKRTVFFIDGSQAIFASTVDRTRGISFDDIVLYGMYWANPVFGALREVRHKV